MDSEPKPWRWENPERPEWMLDADGEELFMVYNITPPEARLIAQAPAMYALLKELEWSEEWQTGYAEDYGWEPGPTLSKCPNCGGYEPDGVDKNAGHAPDCRLAAILKEIDDAQ